MGNALLPTSGERSQHLTSDEFDSLRDRLVRRLGRLGYAEPDAEDLVHEAFIESYRRNGIVNLEAWLWERVRLQGLNLRKKERRRAELLSGWIEQRLLTPAGDPGVGIDLRTDFAAALQRLSRVAQRVIAFRLDGYTDDAIAREFRIPSEKVAALWLAAHRQLRDLLKGYE